MAGNDSSCRRMDLNLYLGLPRSPRPLSLDLGSDLALSSLPLPTDMSGLLEPSNSHTPYSPSRASFAPDLSPADPLPLSGGDPSPEYSPYSPAYQHFSSSYQPSVSHYGSDVPYSPAYAQSLPTVEETDETVVGDGSPHMPYNPVPLPGLVDEPLAVGSDFHVPYSPSYVPQLPLSAFSQLQDEAPFTPYQPVPIQTGDSLASDDRPSLPPDLLRCPQFRFRTLIESQRQSQHRHSRRRFRSLPYRDESFNFATSSLTAPDRVLREIMSSGGTAEASGKNKLSEEGIVDEALEEGTEEKSGTAVNYECNVCLDVAKEPVVTSCGHLFCWPCLYQWLHLHSDHKECPVCKGEVADSNITPIYGRGTSETRVEKKGAEDGDLGLKIPPRPHGRRFESSRHRIPRPVSRRLGEGVTNSLMRIVDEEIHNGNRLEAHADHDRRLLTRWRARRLLRDVDNLETVSNLGETGLPRHNVPVFGETNSLFRDGMDLWHQFSFGFASTDRLAATSTDLSRLGSFAGSGNHLGASASSSNMQNPVPLAGRPPTVSTPAADQASASSTMAVIQGDAGVADAAGEPNHAGSSRTIRRRGMNSASSSSDVEGGVLLAHKRRRLN